MKVFLLAGGYGTRLSEETELRPKPMIEIGGKPILWHIMKHYSHYGYNEFVVLLGYKGYLIKEYFANYFLHTSDVTLDLAENRMDVHQRHTEPWKVTLVDTGLDTLTGSRILKARAFAQNEAFMLTYGDGVSDLDIGSLVQFHRARKGMVTMTTVQPEGRYGSVDIGTAGLVRRFMEKPSGDGVWVNGGFFVCEPEMFDYLAQGDKTSFEAKTLETLAQQKRLIAYQHQGFWKCMDTQRDKVQLNNLWDTGHAPWKIWE